MNKNFNLILTSIVISGLLIITSVVFAATEVPEINTDKVVYPIAELGSCKNQADCQTYCEKSENMLACVTYAEKQGLLKGEDLRMSKIVAEKISKNETPGQCKDKASCENYCKGNVAHIEECVSFAEELNVLPKDELDQAKNILKALKGGAKMPGQCTTKDDCEKYCESGSHIDECLSFAEAANILPPEELKQAKMVAPFLKNGETPGKCQTKKECDNYCKEGEHFTECVSFAEKVGFISKEDAEMARKVGGVGPGGCKNKEECMTYCNDSNHAKECADFAISKGLVDEKTADLIKNGVDQMIQAMNSLPAPMKDFVMNCLNKEIGTEQVKNLLAKTAVPTKDQGEKIQSCFSEIKDKAREIMMGGDSGGQIPAGVPTDRIPNSEDIKNMIPKNVPQEMRDQIEKQIESQIQNQTKNIPTSGSGIPSGPIPAPSNVGGGQAPNVDCSAFTSVPSCSFVPSGIPRDMCEKCKGE